MRLTVWPDLATFEKFLETDSLTKLAQILGSFLGYFKNLSF